MKSILNSLHRDELMIILDHLRKELVEGESYSYVRVGETSKAMQKLTQGPIENFKNMEWRPDFKKLGSYRFIFKWKNEQGEIIPCLEIYPIPMIHPGSFYTFKYVFPTIGEIMQIPGIFLGSVGPSIDADSRYFIGNLHELVAAMTRANDFSREILLNEEKYTIKKERFKFTVTHGEFRLLSVVNIRSRIIKRITIRVGEDVLLLKNGQADGFLDWIELHRPSEFYKINLNIIISALNRDEDTMKALIEHLVPTP